MTPSSYPVPTSPGTNALGIARPVELPPPGLPLTPTVTLQLQSAGGGCWGAEYRQPIRNQLHLFKARSG